MEPCMNHSGLEATMRSQQERIMENIENQKRIHERIDKVQQGQEEIMASIQEHKEQIFEKINDYAKQMTTQYNSTIEIFNAKDGVISEMARMKHNQDLMFKVLGWGSSIIGILTVLFKTQIGRFLRWFFSPEAM
jgi:ABC-type Fe3+-citrate transport system substrate-binding protein